MIEATHSTIRLSRLGGGNKRRRPVAGLVVLIGCLTVGMTGCNRSDWNWDLDWWRAQDRRVEPADRQTADSQPNETNTATVSRSSKPTSPTGEPVSNDGRGGDGSGRSGTGS